MVKKPVIPEAPDGYEWQTLTDTGEELTRTPNLRGGTTAHVRLPKRRGRPTERDWQGVLRWLVAKVAKGGLPRGRGAQAEVEGWMLARFSEHPDGGPSQSMVKEQVRLIYEELSKAGK